MSLSKPLISLAATYLQNLYLYPIKTKSITSCVLAATANVSSQLIAGEKKINLDSVLAFAAFGLFFGGSLPHYFFQFLGKVFPNEGVRQNVLRQILIERFLYTPFFQAFSIYMVSRFEGKDHRSSVRFMQSLLQSVVVANWKWLTIFQIMNLTVVPPVFRVLFVNLIGFFWVMYVAKLRRSQAAKRAPKPNPNS